MRSRCFHMLAVGLLLAAPATAAIHGVARVPGVRAGEPEFNPYAGRASSMAHHARPPRGLATDAVIYLETVPAGADSAAPAAEGRPRLAQKDQSFAPRVVVTPVGGVVDFPNQDPIYHNVFSVSPPCRFDLGKYPRGQSRSVRFTKPGLVNVYCDIHADMAAFILVVPNRAFARPAENGTWRLPAVPPGRYVLAWWHPDYPGGRREIEVPASGDLAVDVEF